MATSLTARLNSTRHPKPEGELSIRYIPDDLIGSAKLSPTSLPVSSVAKSNDHPLEVRGVRLALESSWQLSA